jgi:hypothetical protein
MASRGCKVKSSPPLHLSIPSFHFCMYTGWYLIVSRTMYLAYSNSVLCSSLILSSEVVQLVVCFTLLRQGGWGLNHIQNQWIYSFKSRSYGCYCPNYKFILNHWAYQYILSIHFVLGSVFSFKENKLGSLFWTRDEYFGSLNDEQ